jgi:Ca2+-binding RTX toxin-like protein
VRAAAFQPARTTEGATMATITGTPGDDLLAGTPDNDTIDGLGGDDTLALTDPTAALTWQLGRGRVLGVATQSGGTDTLESVEHVQATDGTVTVSLDPAANYSIPGSPEMAGFDVWNPQLTTLKDGTFVVTWEAGDIPRTMVGALYGRTQFGVYTQHYDASGAPLGAPQTIESISAQTVDHRMPAVASLADGGYVVSWEWWSPDLASTAIAVQRFDAGGAKVGTQALLNMQPYAVTAAPQQPAQLLGLSNGDYLVAYTAPDGSGTGVYTQRFDASGTQLGVPTLVNTSGTTDTANGASMQYQPQLASLADGGYIVAWMSSADVCLQRFDASGARVGTETVVAHGGPSVDVAGLAGGGYAVTSAAGTQFFDATGHQTASDPAHGPEIEARPDGGALLVTTLPYPGAAPEGVLRFDAAGQRVGGPVTLAPALETSASSQLDTNPGVAVLPDGSFLVAWDMLLGVGLTQGSQVHLQRFDANGIPDTCLSLTGGPGNDVLRVAFPSERVALNGGAGDDVLSVAPGTGRGALVDGVQPGPPMGIPGTDDIFTGGPGNDTFDFAAAYNGVDTITDWSRGDRITVAGAQFSGAVVAGTGLDAAANQVQVRTTGDVTTLYVGTDAAAGADVVIRLLGHFTASDFSIHDNVVEWSAAPAPAPVPAPPQPAPAPAPVPAPAPAPEPAPAPPPGPADQGTRGDDTLVGTAGNDRLDGIAGNDSIDGGDGTDTALVDTAVARVLSYSIADGVVMLTTPLGTETLRNIERVQFSDALFALDTSPGGHVWQAAALYHAGFGALPGRTELSHWTAAADASSTMGELAQKMLDHYAPGIATDQLVASLYQQIAHAAPSAQTVQAFVDQVGAGKTYATQADLVAFAANLSLNVDGVASIVGTVQQLDPAAF